MLPLLTFEPLLKERVWGGNRLAELFGKPVPAGARIGESWEVTDRPEGVSIIASGPLAGRTLRWLMEEHGPELLGRPVQPGERFPWLVKLLDAREDLSLQVHPPAHLAAQLRGEPKTEMWYVADASPEATLHVGLKQGVTKSEFETRTADGSVAACFHQHRVRQGDVMFVPSGRVHALGGGMVVFEIQQNSDTTYRVFDWNRVGLDGKPRELHLSQAMASIDFTDFEPPLVADTWATTAAGIGVRPLVRHALFHIDHWRLDAGAALDLPGGTGPRLVAAVAGTARVTSTGTESVDRAPGGFVLIPSSRSASLTAAGAAECLVVRPAPPAA
jgi:mannose-6-phosphate isomerase